MITILVWYWILTTAYGIYWLIKHPRFDDEEDFSILDVLANVFPAALISWIAIPMFILGSIKFKRNK